MAKLVIDEAFLGQIETLQMIIKNNVGGMFGGNRKSKTFGSSCEFADYRDYIPGDDFTKIDWNAFARFDKLYMKLYLDERQMHTRIYIDVSRSMDYGDGAKAKQALRLAATLAYLSVAEMDKVSIYAIRDGKMEDIVLGMVGKESYIASIGKLNEVEFSGDSYITEAVLPTNVGNGDGLSVIISDYLTDNDYEGAVDQMVDRRRDVLCVQVLSKNELNPQIRGKSHLFDSENLSREYRKNIDREIMQAYRDALAYATGRIRDYCHARGAEYMLCSAEDAVSDIFFRTLPNLGVLK